MPTYIVQAVQRSGDGLKSVRVASRWPYACASLDDAKAFVDATPPFSGWDHVDSFEIVTMDGKLLAARPCNQAEVAWVDDCS